MDEGDFGYEQRRTVLDNLQPSTRKWLIENNGDVVLPAFVAGIGEAGGPL